MLELSRTEQRIAELEAELVTLKSKKAAIQALTPEQRVAEEIYSRRYYNRADTDWGYHSWQETDLGHTRAHLLIVAKRIMKLTDNDETKALAIIEAVFS